MKYTAKGTHNRHFELLDENNSFVGRLDYESWFTTSALIELPDGAKYNIEKGSFWHTTIQLLKEGNLLCTLSFNWKRQIVLVMADGREYMQRLSSAFSFHYEMIDRQEEQVLTMHQDFNLSKLTFNYNLDVLNNNTGLPDAVVALLNIYCANYRRNLSGA